MYRFLLKPRWLLLHLTALALAGLFINLGLWQLRRLETRQARNSLLQTRLALPPEPLAVLLERYDPDLPPSDPGSAAYRPAQVTGRYDPTHEVLWRTTQNYNGEPGYFLLTPLVLENGQAVLVDRGWVPFRLQTVPVTEAPPPSGQVELTGTVIPARRPPQGPLANLAPRDPPGPLAITAYADPDRLGQQVPYTLLPLYLELQTQTPTQLNELPLPLEPPDFSDGPHLGYAIQWFSFTIIGVIGYLFILRRVAVSRTDPAL